jgi:hypothetical protein
MKLVVVSFIGGHIMNTPTFANSFPLGQTVVTRNALDVLEPEDVRQALQRHTTGDWGDVCAADKAENELSLREGFRLLSAYKDRHGTAFWIITEANREVSTVLLPEDY